jgi:hypothetical protein
MKTEPILLNWTVGGTGLTNFNPQQAWLFRAAIKEFGNPNYVIVKAPCKARHVISSDYSLHKLDILTNDEDCGPFWDVFMRLQKELTA